MIGPITPQELSKLIAAGGNDPEVTGGSIHLFDLRSPEQFRRGHVPGSRQVPHEAIERWIPQRAATHELVVLIDDQGAGGGTAREAASHLVHAWFRRVRYLKGGFAAYAAAGLPTATDGPTGLGGDSSEGSTAERLSSASVRWKAPDPSKTPRVV